MTLWIAGIGTAAPAHDVEQEKAAEFHARLSELDSGRTRTLKALYRRSGVGRRGSVLLHREEGTLDERQDLFRPDDPGGGPSTAERMAAYEGCAPKLAVAVTERALEDAGVPPSSVSHLVTVSCTGFVAPGTDAHLIRELHLSPEVERTHVGFMGCHGALNGLRVARGFAEADPSNVVVVCAVELCSLHFAGGWDADTLVANALFADGAGAVVGRGEAADTAMPGWKVVATGSRLLEDSEEAMTWRIGDQGFRMTLSSRVPEIIRSRLGPWLGQWLGRRGLGLDDVGSWAIHPGGPRILDAVEEAVGIESGAAEVSREVLAEHGNMSSATILFVLERLRARDAARPCVALAFGPGLVVEAALFV